VVFGLLGVVFTTTGCGFYHHDWICLKKIFELKTDFEIKIASFVFNFLNSEFFDSLHQKQRMNYELILEAYKNTITSLPRSS
jgi:hypothetical protein